jgi:hypothetical protein
MVVRAGVDQEGSRPHALSSWPPLFGAVSALQREVIGRRDRGEGDRQGVVAREDKDFKIYGAASGGMRGD